ncbi:MAG: dipeptidase [bacterium]|nr:dipeptidase [bacterium]
MQKISLAIVLTVALLLQVLAPVTAGACTNYLVSKGASADGSTMITYVADAHVLYGELYYTPPGRHLKDSMMKVYDWDSGRYLGEIKQVEETYSVVGNMNEHQVAIGETTYGGRKELRDPKGIVDYGSLMYIALQRSKTAREAIDVMTGLANEYGYASSGESFSISDKNEVWIFEIIAKGPKNKGIVWVARRVPEGYICAHANQARIRQFPLKDKNCLYAPDVITFAREQGYFKGEDKDFSFVDAYAPPDFGALRFCEARVWNMFNRAAPSLKIAEKYGDYVKGNPKAEPLPLWIKPDNKLTARDVIELMRDHFEGTDLDMTKDIGAGPYRLPYRWRPLEWKVDGVSYFNERAVSTQQTGFSFVAQSRSWLPDPIGGINWFSVDDTYSTVYIPMYCGIQRVPKSFAVGTADFHAFSWDSAFWVFNFVSNFAYSRYCEMIEDIQILQRELEGKFFANQKQIDDAALILYNNGKTPQLARNFLTEYSVKQGDDTVKRWKKLGEYLVYKYMDGNIKAGNEQNSKKKVEHPGYPKAWYKHIVKETGDKFKSKDQKPESH